MQHRSDPVALEKKLIPSDNNKIENIFMIINQWYKETNKSLVCFPMCCVLFTSTSCQILLLLEEKPSSVCQHCLTKSRTRSSSLPSTG